MSNNDFEIQYVEKEFQRRFDNKFKHLNTKIQIQIASNNEQLMINKKILDCFNMTKNVLHINTRRFVVANVDVNEFFILQIF